MKRFPAMLAAMLCACGAAALPEGEQGGIGFRFDDNQTVEKWRDVAAVFDRYRAPFGMSINFGKLRADDTAFRDLLRDRQRAGCEIFDHTLTHTVFRCVVPTEAEAEALRGRPWVDHVTKNVVYFAYRIKPGTERGRFRAAVSGNRVAVPAEWKKELGRNWLVSIPALKREFMLRPHAGTMRLTSFWDEDNVALGDAGELEFVVLDRAYSFVPHDDALRFLAESARRRCAGWGLEAPVTWAQPGSSEPIITAEDVRRIFGREYGYRSAGTYQRAALKVFGEPDPERCRFAMQWGNFNLERMTVPEVKQRIADWTAKHYVLIASSHLDVRQVPGGWAEYLRRHDELLAWCRESGIPVRTQRDWAERLYGRPPAAAAGEMMPSPLRDCDRNGVPDGYQVGPGVTVRNGRWQSSAPGLIWRIDRLGGLEPGRNRLTMTVEGAPGARLTVQAEFFGHAGSLGPAQSWRPERRDGGCELELEVPEAAAVVTLTLSREGGDGGLTVGAASCRPVR